MKSSDKGQWGGRRVAGPGKKLGRPAFSDEEKALRVATRAKNLDALYLTDNDRCYLMTFTTPEKSASAAVREMITVMRRFFPDGLVR